MSYSDWSDGSTAVADNQSAKAATSQKASRIKADPKRRDYMDLALTPVTEDELDELDLYTSSEAARAAVEKTHEEEARRQAHLEKRRASTVAGQ